MKRKAITKRKPVSLNPEKQLKDPSLLWEPPPEKGDSVPASVRLGSLTKRHIQEAVQSGLFRFKTENDLVRTAVAFFMREKVMQYMVDGRFDTSLRTAAMLNRLMLDLQKTNDVETFVGNLRRAVHTMLRNNLVEKARRHMQEVMQHLRELNDREWAEEAEGQIRRTAMLTMLLEPTPAAEP